MGVAGGEESVLCCMAFEEFWKEGREGGRAEICYWNEGLILDSSWPYSAGWLYFFVTAAMVVKGRWGPNTYGPPSSSVGWISNWHRHIRDDSFALTR